MQMPCCLSDNPNESDIRNANVLLLLSDNPNESDKPKISGDKKGCLVEDNLFFINSAQPIALRNSMNRIALLLIEA